MVNRNDVVDAPVLWEVEAAKTFGDAEWPSKWPCTEGQPPKVCTMEWCSPYTRRRTQSPTARKPKSIDARGRLKAQLIDREATWVEPKSTITTKHLQDRGGPGVRRPLARRCRYLPLLLLLG